MTKKLTSSQRTKVSQFYEVAKDTKGKISIPENFEAKINEPVKNEIGKKVKIENDNDDNEQMEEDALNNAGDNKGVENDHYEPSKGLYSRQFTGNDSAKINAKPEKKPTKKKPKKTEKKL